MNEMINLEFRRAENQDLYFIWPMFQDAIERRRKDGSSQWQDGYPNEKVILEDISLGRAYVILNEKEIIGYTALIFNDEPAYDQIDGAWLTHGDFAVLHRIVISTDYLGKGLAGHILKCSELKVKEQGVFSMRADTNFDNPGMIRTFEKAGYKYCGEVKMRGGIRRAFEKILL